MKEIIILNDIYRSLLGRDVDESGIQTYLPRLKANLVTGKHTIEQDIRSSDEYKNGSPSMDSMSGDRSSYINQNNTILIDSSRFKNILNNLITHIIYIENHNYPKQLLENRILTIKKSITHSGEKSLPFTIFPHMEYDFCTDRFNESLKDFNNFKYYVIYMSIAAIWKLLFGKVVETCGTINFINKILQSHTDNIDSIINNTSNEIINYLSIRICGRLLDTSEMTIAKQFLIDHNSNDLINYISNIDIVNYNNENNSANNNIIELTNRLGRKPKVLIMVAYLETQNPLFIEKTLYHLKKVKEINSNLDIDFALDNERIPKENGDYTPWSRVKRIRNLMINKYPIYNYDYLYIIDSDIIDYPHNFLTRAIGLNPSGITAPLALIQNSVVFYDWCGYQKKDATSLYGQYKSDILVKASQKRNFNLQPPYIEDKSRLVEIDCVGCTYVVPTQVFSQTYGNMQQELLETFKLANVTNHKIAENIVQYEDHPSFTDHYTICAAVRANGGKILMDRCSAAYHADLPIHGEAWH